MEDYKIRSAYEEDLVLLAPIERSAANLFQRTPYSFLVSAEPLPLEFVQKRFQSGQVWVAVSRGNTVIGYAITDEVDDTLYLQQIDVEPAHGRRGVGSRLISTVCAWAKNQGYRIVSLSTFRDLPWNAPFYARLGFRILDESELTPGFQQIRLKEAEAGLPTSERVIMQCELYRIND
ncbi:MAG: GNAT family N-acetyltransferase [Nodosilinea sp.]